MPLTRRDFLVSGAAAALAAGKGASAGDAGGRATGPARWQDWAWVRAQFELDPDYIHMAGLLLASNPAPVRAAIAEYRQALDRNPALYAQENRLNLEHRARRAAAYFLGTDYGSIALTDSTTLGLALVYRGLRVRPDQELLTTEEDYYATHQALRYKQRDSGANLRVIPLLPTRGDPSEEQIVDTLVEAVAPHTRVLALTWVHSKSGLKLPLQRIADAIDTINRQRELEDRVLLCIDGVHALGVEAFDVTALGCDFFVAGTHKWLFGPRGTGIVWGRRETRNQLEITVPTFTPDGTWGGPMTPGGFKPFEHQWALSTAFAFQQRIGRQRIAERIHALNRQMKEGLAQMAHVQLHTPLETALSAGIVCFDIAGRAPDQVVAELLAHGIVASTTPYTPTHARVTPGIINTPEEVEKTLAAIHALA